VKDDEPGAMANMKNTPISREEDRTDVYAEEVRPV
jgi:hypothetical protein